MVDSVQTLESFAPASGERIGRVPVATPEDVAETVRRAHDAQAAWGILPVTERCERLVRLRDAIVQRAEEIVHVVSLECGKPRAEALVEVTATAAILSYYCKHAPSILAPRDIPLTFLKHKKSSVHYFPRGVVGVIAPWNFPFVIPMGDVIAALVTGSAAVVKPSEVTPLTMEKAKEIFRSTGMPEDLLGVVHGGGTVGSALIESGIQKLVFTGGTETGRKVAAACGQNLVPCVLELGGKAPLVACGDCDVERTARAIVFGGFFNAGQACISVERVYAHASIYDRLVDRVGELTRDLRVGDPQKGIVEVGALTIAKQAEIAERQIADAVAKGARVVAGGKRHAAGERFFEPTVLANCNHSMLVMTEESFGPLVPIQRVASDDEGIRFANDSDVGLNAYVFTDDRARGSRLAERIRAGSVVVNDVLLNYGSPEAPFGGVKKSGFGRVHGDDALRDMAEARHVFSSRIPEPPWDPLWFPYSEKAYVWQARALRALFGGGGIVERIGRLF